MYIYISIFYGGGGGACSLRVEGPGALPAACTGGARASGRCCQGPGREFFFVGVRWSDRRPAETVKLNRFGAVSRVLRRSSYGATEVPQLSALRCILHQNYAFDATGYSLKQTSNL